MHFEAERRVGVAIASEAALVRFGLPILRLHATREVTSRTSLLLKDMVLTCPSTL